MNERGLEVLEQYDINVEKIAKGRGVYQIFSEKGLYILFLYSGTEGRLRFEANLLEYIREAGFERVDVIVKTKEGNLFSVDDGGEKYVLKKWYIGRECDVKKTSDIIEAVQTLACLHICTDRVVRENIRDAAPMDTHLIEEYIRHNREMKRVRSFIRNRNCRSKFEYEVLAHFDEYYGYGKTALMELENSNIDILEDMAYKCCSICHGTYNYHNLIFDGTNIAVVNFNHSCKGLQIKDLYFFLRKVMEKHDWNVSLGGQIIEKYDMVKNIGKEEKKILEIMLSYPEKFWKVLNQYNSSNKSWIPDKNIEKLEAVYRQQELKRRFVEKIWK